MMKEKKEETKYYYISSFDVIGKREDGKYFIYEEGEWVDDTEHLIQDRLIGYDPYEPSDSPYKIGNTDIMCDIEDVTESYTALLKDEKVVKELCEKWKKDFAEAKKKWDENPGWPAKYVTVGFELNTNTFVLQSTDIGLSDSNWDQGFMETVQSEMMKDLEEIGAKNIYKTGFMD